MHEIPNFVIEYARHKLNRFRELINEYPENCEIYFQKYNKGLMILRNYEKGFLTIDETMLNLAEL